MVAADSAHVSDWLQLFSARVLPIALVVFLAFLVPAATASDRDLERAREAVHAGRYEQGLKLLDGLPRDAPESRQKAARALRVQVYLETGRYQEAVAEAARLESIRPRDPDVLTLHAKALVEVGRYALAREKLAAAVSLDENHYRSRLQMLLLAEIIGDDTLFDKQVDYFFDLYNNDDKTQTADTIASVARAVQKEVPNDAWRAYREAWRQDPNHWETYIFEGFLAYEKYAWADARKSFSEVLERNPNHALAQAGLAAVFLANSKYDEADQTVAKALAVNPNLPLALEIKAAMYAVERQFDKGLEQIRKIIAVNPNSLDGLSLLAAHYENAGKTKQRDAAIAKAQSIHPNYVGVYVTLAEAAERMRQFPRAIAWARKAIKTDPDDWQGYHIAGMNLLRSGEEKEGYRLLEEAWQRNRFNVWCRNMLVVMDKDFKKHQFTYFNTPHFLVKLHRKEADVLWPYIEPLVEAAYETFTRKYDIQPEGALELRGKLLLSMFPKHEDFSARTVGLPGLPALGACFGRIITMPSPRFGIERQDLFNWRRVFEHEFLHVLTLQKTDYRIPRWFTEGISTYEEQDPQIKYDRLLVSAIARDKLLPLETINVGFNRPSFPQQMALSYYHASLVVRYFVETYGHESLQQMMKLYRAGRRDKDVLETVFKKPIAELTREVLDYVKNWAEQIKITPPPSDEEFGKLEQEAQQNRLDAASWTQLASAYVGRRRFDEARRAARNAIQNDPRQARAHGVLGYLAYQVDKDNRAAKRHFTEAKSADPNYVYARVYLGLIYRKEGLTREAITEFEAVRKLYPRLQDREKSPHHNLADLYEQSGQPDQAIAVLREVTRISNRDYDALVRLARLLVQERRYAKAAAAYLDAFYINPFEEQIHLEAGDAYENAGQAKAAAREFKVASILSDYRNLEALVGWARTAAAAGQTDAARQAIRSVRRIDPTHLEADRIERLLGK